MTAHRTPLPLTRHTLTAIGMAAALLLAPAAARADEAQPPAAAQNAAQDAVQAEQAKPGDFADAIAEGMSKGSASRKYYQALTYERGRGRQHNPAKALSLLQQSAAEGFAPAQTLLGALYVDGQADMGLTRDDKKAAEWLQKSLAQNPKNPSTLYYLGTLYGQGLGGLAKDIKKQFDYYAEAADGGFAPAQHGMGYMYLQGDGAPQDYKKALFWMEKSAQQDMPESQYNIGYIYLKGMGVAPDTETALNWFGKAAKLGYPPAYLTLAHLYRTGEDGVAKDDKKALPWYQKSAQSGDAQAAWELGVMYDHGEGTDKNRIKAYFWFTVAQAYGRSGLLVSTRLWLERMSLSDTELDAAEKAVNSWKASGAISPDML